MTITTDTSQANRADLMLVALLSMEQVGRPRTRSQLEKELTRLVRDDHVGAFFQPYYRQALLHRAVVETLAYLETNGYIQSDLAVTRPGSERVERFADMRRDVDRALASVDS